MVGRVIVGVVGLCLSGEERHALSSQQIFGVILFSRNYQNKEQLRELIISIKSINPTLLVFVDQEGAIWRFDRGFYRIPTANYFGDCYDRHGEKVACEEARSSAYVMAKELRDVGVDVTIAPVVDVHDNKSAIIGQRGRAFHQNPDVVTTLAKAFMGGLSEAGCLSIIKHFPGHGSAHGDTHTDQVVDDRAWDVLKAKDVKPFRDLLRTGSSRAVMIGHVVYPAVDDRLAVFSKKWVDILRAYNPDVCAFTDCLGMAGAGQGSDRDKCQRAIEAGCDVLVYSNQIYREENTGLASVVPKPISEVLEAVSSIPDSQASQRRRKSFV